MIVLDTHVRVAVYSRSEGRADVFWVENAYLATGSAQALNEKLGGLGLTDAKRSVDPDDLAHIESVPNRNANRSGSLYLR